MRRPTRPTARWRCSKGSPPPPPSAPPGPRAAGWDALAEVCARRDAPLVLVVDDFHHMAGDATGAALERLLLAGGDRRHLVVATRTPPPLNLARTELASAVLGASDLRFRPAETLAPFRDALGLPLTDADARTVTRRTGGRAVLFRGS